MPWAVNAHDSAAICFNGLRVRPINDRFPSPRKNDSPESPTREPMVAGQVQGDAIMRAWVLAAAAAMGLATQAGAVTVSYNSGPLDLVSACYAEWREFDCLAEGGSVPTRMYWTADFDIADEDLEFEEGVASVEFGPDYVSESNVRSYLWDGSAWVEDDFVWGSILIFLTMKLSETGTASDWNIMMEHSVYDWIWYLDVIDGAPAVTGWFARETETDLPVRAIYATAPAPVPLPAGGVLLLSGLMAAGLLRKRVSR